MVEVGGAHSENSPPGGQTFSGYAEYNTVPTHPQSLPATQPTGWFARIHKNKPQSNSAGAASIIFICGGMNMAFGVDPVPTTYIMPQHVRFSWFIAAILGALMGAVLCNRLQKKLIFLYSSFVIIVGGILLVSLQHSINGMIAARYLTGFGSGLVLAPTLVMAGEEGVKSMRGMIVSSIEVLCFTTGIFVGLIFNAVWIKVDTNFTILQLHGVMNIFWGVVAAIFAYLLTIESPVYFLLRNQEENAVDALRRLQRPFIVTTETDEQLEEHKRYILFNKDMSFKESAVAGLPALLKLSIYRGLAAISYSGLLNLGYLVLLLGSDRLSETWLFILYGAARWFGVLYTCFKMDSAGRKNHMLYGACICAGLAIGVGIIFANLKPHDVRLTLATVMLMFFQLFAGVFITSSSPYLSEAFPLAIKPFYIAAAFSVEMLVHIIIISVYSEAVDAFLCTAGALMLLFLVFGIFCFPETKQTTLLEAQAKFRDFFVR